MTVTYVLGLVILGDCHTGLATEAGDLNGGNLVVESAGLLGSLSLLVGADGVLILLLTVEVMVLSTLLGGKAHELLLSIGILKAVLHDSVHHGLVTVLGAGAQAGEVVGGVGHGLSATGDDDIGVSGHDGLGTEDDGLQTRGADLVNGGANGGVGETSIDGALTGGVLSNTDNDTLASHRSQAILHGAYPADRTLPKKTSWTSEALIPSARSTAAINPPLVSIETGRGFVLRIVLVLTLDCMSTELGSSQAREGAKKKR